MLTVSHPFSRTKNLANIEYMDNWKIFTYDQVGYAGLPEYVHATEVGRNNIIITTFWWVQKYFLT